MQALDNLLRDNVGKVYSAASVEIRLRGGVIYRSAFGTLDPAGKLDAGNPARTDTLFDLASVSKLFTTTAFFRLIDGGRVTLDTPVCKVLPEFTGSRAICPYPNPLVPGAYVTVVPPTDETVDASAVKFRDLLTHSSGLPAWINLREANSEDARRTMCLTTPFAYPTGTRVVYSDVGYILLGMAIERLTGRPLDRAVKILVQKPLYLGVEYGPIDNGNVAPTEFCHWRQRRVIGEVHDENSATLHGIAGHAGLFGTAADVATLGHVYLMEGSCFVSTRLAREAVVPHIENRGLGWMTNAADASCGRYFSPNSFGHTGFTGTSVWVDPERQLVVALLTNRVFFGRDPEPITAFRQTFHDTVIEALEGSNG